MRIASKPALLTVPVVMFIALVAVLALWANGSIGGNGERLAAAGAARYWAEISQAHEHHGCVC